MFIVYIVEIQAHCGCVRHSRSRFIQYFDQDDLAGSLTKESLGSLDASPVLFCRPREGIDSFQVRG